MTKHISIFAMAIALISGPVAAFGDIASSDYVDKRIETTVSKTGNQTVGGTKTYTTSPIIPTPELP